MRFLLAIFAAALTHHVHAAPPRLDGKTAAERGAAMVRYVAGIKPAAKDEKHPKAAAPCYAARLVLNVDTEYALEKLHAAASYQISKGRDRLARQAAYDQAKDKSTVKRPGPALDPFDKAALVNTYFLGKDKIPQATAHKIRDYVALYDDHKALTGYARGAWNYKLMMDASGYLAAEEWPELVDRAGQNAEQIKQATKARLFSGFNDITKKNFSEYGATIYLGVNLSAIRMLVEYTQDPEMRNRATLAMDAMMLDIACTWNQGYNVGSASRAKYWGSTDTCLESMASTAAAAWISFGARRSISAAGIGYIHSFWMATPGVYKVPDLIVKVAQQRAGSSATTVRCSWASSAQNPTNGARNGAITTCFGARRARTDGSSKPPNSSPSPAAASTLNWTASPKPSSQKPRSTSPPSTPRCPP